MKAIDRQRLKSLMEREQKRFVDERPKSKALFERARKSLLGGVPMNWMMKWAGAHLPHSCAKPKAPTFSTSTGTVTSTSASATPER